MTCGLPVALSRAGGNPELVTDGESGLLLDPRDYAGSAEALVRLLSDEPRRRAMAERARTRGPPNSRGPRSSTRRWRCSLRPRPARLAGGPEDGWTRPAAHRRPRAEVRGRGRFRGAPAPAADRLRQHPRGTAPADTRAGVGSRGSRCSWTGCARPRICVDRLPIHLDFDPVLIARLWSWFRRKRPDIVHTHLLHADVHAGLAARLAGVPVVISTKHNDDRFRRYRPVRWIECALASCTDRTIAISDALRAFHLRMSAVDPSSVTTIHYGYAPPAPSQDNPGLIRRELGLPAGNAVVLAVGRLVIRRGTTSCCAPARWRAGRPPNRTSSWSAKASDDGRSPRSRANWGLPITCTCSAGGPMYRG